MKSKVNRRIAAAAIATMGIWSISGAASAAFIEGSIGFGGNFSVSGGSGLLDATGMDITFAGVTTASGDLAPALGSPASFNHLDFDPANTPVTPLWTVDLGGVVFSFDLLSVNVDDRSDTALNLSGFGTLMGTGFDDTAGAWTFSGNSLGTLFTFSSITASQVPVPATLLLVGIGLAGFGVARRRTA